MTLISRLFRKMSRGLVAVSVLVVLGTAYGQMMPGMDATAQKSESAGAKTQEEAAPATDKPKTIIEKRDALRERFASEDLPVHRKLYLLLASEESPYRGIVLAFLTVAVLSFLKKYTTRLFREYAAPRAQKAENVEGFLRTWNTVWKFVIGIFLIIALSGSLKLLGLSAAFLGMMLGWSLQAPVTGLAAWLMIILKRPFRIGDRVIIAGIMGDVSDITLTHVVMNQVGGTIGGEEPSGRAVLIPNAILFNNIIMNYTLQESFMLDEVPVRLTFDSDWELARSIVLAAAAEVTAEIIQQTGQQPFIRCEFFDAGVLVRLRYQSIPARRQEFSSLITEKITAEFKKHYPAVKFCYPHSITQYRWQEE